MSEASEIRMGLLRRRISYEDFAERCGISLESFKEMMNRGDLSGEVLNEYAALDVVDVVGGIREQEFGEETEDRCHFGRECLNDRIQIIEFEDGRRAGMVRKRKEFRPKYGLPCEVRDSGESGWLELVGKYRSNGVRLD
tara:strand:- start:1258 stop:1674 length:417 start_codon:yes stop_codon:yes gene_type:complete